MIRLMYNERKEMGKRNEKAYNLNELENTCIVVSGGCLFYVY